MGTEFECIETYPCTSDKTFCWPIRPAEKTLWIWFWFTVTGVQVILAIGEIVGLGIGKVKTSYENHFDITKEYRIGRKQNKITV